MPSMPSSLHTPESIDITVGVLDDCPSQVRDALQDQLKVWGFRSQTSIYELHFNSHFNTGYESQDGSDGLCSPLNHKQVAGAGHAWL